jgi:hypothetical protein
MQTELDKKLDDAIGLSIADIQTVAKEDLKLPTELYITENFIDDFIFSYLRHEERDNTLIWREITDYALTDLLEDSLLENQLYFPVKDNKIQFLEIVKLDKPWVYKSNVVFTIYKFPYDDKLYVKAGDEEGLQYVKLRPFTYKELYEVYTYSMSDLLNWVRKAEEKLNIKLLAEEYGLLSEFHTTSDALYIKEEGYKLLECRESYFSYPAYMDFEEYQKCCSVIHKNNLITSDYYNSLIKCLEETKQKDLLNKVEVKQTPNILQRFGRFFHIEYPQ